MLNVFNKASLVEMCRRMGLATGDTARNDKLYYINMLVAHPEQAEVEKLVAEFSVTAKRTQASMPVALISANPLPAVHPEGIKCVSHKPASAVFGIRGKNASIIVDVWNDPDAPEIDHDYKFDKEKLAAVLIAIKCNKNFWMYGPAGTGKTEFVKNLCGYLGRAYYRVSFDASLEKYDFLGGERAKAGSTVWQDGIVLQAMTRPGAIVLLDEVGFARAEFLSALHAVLEPKAVVTISETGRKVSKASGVIFCAADNSNGTGDPSGLYVGISQKNRAFTSRFGAFIKLDYMAPVQEAEVICLRSKCNKDVAELIVGFLGICRQQALSSIIEEAPSLREAFALAEYWMAGMDCRAAFEMAVVNRLADENAEQFQQLYRANIDEAAVAAAVEGKLAEFRAGTYVAAVA